MAIHPVQPNKFSQTPVFGKEYVPYLEANETVTTDNYVKPLPAKGHLINDNPFSGIKYFFKDIGYDFKSLNNGLKGEANDHQLGRLNGLGMRIGGIGIATYLASQTTNPKTRLMEFIGLASFLLSMSIYPKLAIRLPARILHGYDIDKEYIDDQGRKKSVFQDTNYIPYDLYTGKNKKEDLEVIGDKMGIPRDIPNRDELIKAQMRKIATQNNTLWMLTAGFATPLLTALICNGLENYVVSPGLEKSRNAKCGKMIEHALNETNNLENVKSDIYKKTEELLSKNIGKTLPEEEIDNLVKLLSDKNDSMLREGIKKDINSILNSASGSKVYSINKNNLTSIIEKAGSSMGSEGVNSVIPTSEEIINAIKEIKKDADIANGIELNESELNQLKEKVGGIIRNKAISMHAPEDFIEYLPAQFLNNFEVEAKTVLGDSAKGKLIEFAKIIGDFNEVHTKLDQCKNFKFEFAPETILARYYEKFQTTLVKELNISTKELKQMMEDKNFAQKLIDEKFKSLCENDEKYTKTFEKLSKIMSDMETALHGKNADKSEILNLINAIENLYNNTAARLNKLGYANETINNLVNTKNISSLRNTVSTRAEVEKLLDGSVANIFVDKDLDKEAEKYIKYNIDGKGSAKYREINKILARYQGETNSFYRILHTLDFYKRASNPETLAQGNPESVNDLINIAKKSLLESTASDYTLKLGVVNPKDYQALGNMLYPNDSGEFWSTAQKGKISEATQNGFKNDKKLLERFQMYITRFRNIIFNNTTDFTKPQHLLNRYISNQYTQSERTSEAMFNLVGQNPVEMLQKAAENRFANIKWLKTVGILTTAIFGVTVLSQFAFGKIKFSKEENKKQVKHGNN
ncbi:MAG: DUF1366 domain-containing protein [bacterium]|nr:DUF1366 domain-containing protein [bacterium]